jgi:gliding motility-associated-like protein
VPTGTITITAPTGANYLYSIDGTNYQAGTTFAGLSPGNYNVTVQDQTTGCVSTGVVALTVNSVAGAPVITVLTEVDVTCFGDTDGSASVQVSGGSSPYTYAWSPSGGSGDIATGLAAGNYTVTVTDNVGCSSVQTIVIGTPSLLVVGGVETNVSCTSSTPGSITTNTTGGSGSYTYDWTPNGETTASLTGLAAGSYGVTVTDANGCTATESYTIITSGSIPVTVLPQYSEIDAGESVVLEASGGANYSWTPSTGLSCDTCAVTTASPTTTTTYIVTVSDDNGCFGQDTAIVKVNIMCGEFFVPNIFSPNGTGPSANNKLCVYGTPACVAELNFAIYNRWGEKVFETTDITQCWDGMYKDKLMNSGIFVYKLNATLIDGTDIEESGNITLVH